MQTKFEEIVNVGEIGRRLKINWDDLISLAAKEQCIPAKQDKTKRLLLCVSVQNDFMEQGAAPVVGANSNVEKLTRFIYNNIESISNIRCYNKAYSEQSVIFADWWKNSIGMHPPMYTVITRLDVANEIWEPVMGTREENVWYLQRLKEANKNLLIQPKHCLFGTEGSWLENEFKKMFAFHTYVRKCKNEINLKTTDMYARKTEFSREKYFLRKDQSKEILRLVEKYDEIFIAGESASHDIVELLKQLVKYYSSIPTVLQKITVLVDCTSSIKGYEEKTKLAFKRFHDAYGIKFANSTEIELK